MRKATPILAIIAATTIRWLNGIFVKYLHLPIATQTFLRLGMPCILCGAYLVYKRLPLIPKQRKWFALLSIANALRMFLLIAGYTFTTPTLATVTQRTNVFVGVFLAFLLLKERITRNKILSIIIGFIGVLVMARGTWLSLDNVNTQGIIFVFFSAMISGCMHIGYKKLVETNSIAHLLFYQSIIGTILFGVYALIYNPLPTPLQRELGIVHSVLIGVIGFALYFRWMKLMQAGYSMILLYREIASAAFFSFLFLHEQLSMPTIIGIVCIICSWILVSYWVQKRG